jgi:hypothetical protein
MVSAIASAWAWALLRGPACDTSRHLERLAVVGARQPRLHHARDPHVRCVTIGGQAALGRLQSPRPASPLREPVARYPRPPLDDVTGWPADIGYDAGIQRKLGTMRIGRLIAAGGAASRRRELRVHGRRRR